MKRTDMGVLIAYIREHSESSAIDDALDALAAAARDLAPAGEAIAARDLAPAGEAIAARAVNNLHIHLIESGDGIGASMLERLAFEDVTA